MEKENKERRSFLKHILSGSAVLAGTAAAVKPARAGASQTIDRTGETLYRESESFKKYYKSLRS